VMCDIVWWCFWGLMISMTSLLCIWSVLCVLFLFPYEHRCFIWDWNLDWEGAKAIRLERFGPFFFVSLGTGYECDDISSILDRYLSLSLGRGDSFPSFFSFFFHKEKTFFRENQMAIGKEVQVEALS